MPRKPSPKKATAKAWTPPAGLKIEVGCYRGDISIKTEATVGDVVNVALLLVAMMREVAKQAPDILPYADTVPGTYMPIDPSEIYDEAHGARSVIGFRRPGPPK